MGMNRREFGKSLVAAGAVLAFPSATMAKPSVDHTWDGPHLAEFDYNDALITTLQKAFGTLWYGRTRPEIIMSPSRVVGLAWNAIMPRQRVKVERPWLYSFPGNRSKGFRFNGAIWISNDSLKDGSIVLVNNQYTRDAENHTWKKFNGWYFASRLTMEDPYGDECFRRMQES